jgi:hypothetical protein
MEKIAKEVYPEASLLKQVKGVGRAHDMRMETEL